MLVPISTFFLGLNGLIALALSYIVVVERNKTRIWHGETRTEVANQPNYLENPNWWASWIESYAEKYVASKIADDGILQRKVRAFGNFMEYVPFGLLFIVTLELMQSPSWWLWTLGGALTAGRISHAWGLISTYGPSPARGLGFLLTLFVYILGSIACLYDGISYLAW